jgi:hypothetical protein
MLAPELPQPFDVRRTVDSAGSAVVGRAAPSHSFDTSFTISAICHTWTHICLIIDPTDTTLLLFLFEKLTSLWTRIFLVAQMIQKCFACYGTQKFATVFVRDRHWSLFWASFIQPISSHPVSLRHILILSSHVFLGLTFLFISEKHSNSEAPWNTINKVHGLLKSVYSIWDEN